MARLFLQNRRAFVKAGAALTTSAGLLPHAKLARASEAEPHFFLHLFFPGGMDATCTFDARPLSMTAAEQQTNYVGQDPVEMKGKNGGRALRSNLVNPVLPFFDRFSLINGVIMAPDFDGHEDNQSLLLTGNPLGGSSFHGALGTHLGTPVSAIIGGAPMVSDSRIDTTGGVRMSAKAAGELTKNLSAAGRLGQDARLNQFLRDRFAVGEKEGGSFAKTKLLMGQALGGMPNLAAAISGMEVPPVTGDDETVLDGVKLAASAFRSGFCRSALCVFDTDLSENQNLDAHDFEGAKTQPRIIGELMTELAEILKYLRDTPFSEKYSLLDVTTVLITSEFGRTMRQHDFARSGTDHNALTNSALIGGKGIVGGNIIGASNFASVEEYTASPGKAHLSLDPMKRKIMGRPFDFATQKPVMAKPDEFKLQNYLTAGSLVNTVYSLFKVPETEWRDFGRNTSYAGVLTSILS